MSPTVPHSTGLLARIVAPLLSEPPVCTIPAPDVLAALLDLHGSVDLSEVLRVRARSEELAGARARQRPPLQKGAARARLAEIELGLERRFAAAFIERPRIPDAVAMHAALLEAGVLGRSLAAKDAKDAKADARHVVTSFSAAFRDRLMATIERTLGEMAGLRDEIAEGLRASGPEGARLEALDRALSVASEQGVSRLIERLAAAVERTAFRDLSRAVKLLPPGASAEDLAPWFAEGGIVRAALESIEAAARALFARERAVLEALAMTLGLAS